MKQESYFVWHGSSVGTDFTVEHYDFPEEYPGVMYSAFTVAELAEILAKGNHHFLPSYNSNFDHGWYYKFFNGPTVHEDSLADCMAKMLIYLIENNYITA